MLSFLGVICLQAKGIRKGIHGVGLGLAGNVNIRFHGLVVTVAGPFHDHLRRDAAGEGQADEGAAAGMGAQHLILGEGLLDPLASTETYPGDGIIEAAELAQVLQVVIHLLVGNHRQGVVANGLQILVLVEYGFGIGVQINGQAVVGLLGGNVDVLVRNVLLPEVIHIRETEGREGAEAEKVPGFGQGTGFLDNLLVLVAVHVQQLDLGAVLGNLVIIQGSQFILIKEDDGLLNNLEFGLVPGYGILAGIFLPERPVREPQQVLVLLPDAVVLQALVLAQIGDELVKAGLVKEFKGNVRLEGLHVMLEGKPALVGGIGPLLHGALLSGEFIEHLEERLLPGLLRLGRRGGLLLVQGLVQLLLDLILGGTMSQFIVPVHKVVLDIVQALVDFSASEPLGIAVGPLAHTVAIPHVRIYADAKSRYARNALYAYLGTDGKFPFLVRPFLQKVIDCHNSVRLFLTHKITHNYSNIQINFDLFRLSIIMIISDL